jgi:hypothetical protein
MHGYILYRERSGIVSRASARATSRKVLRRALEGKVPDAQQVIGVVLCEDDSRQLHVVA